MTLEDELREECCKPARDAALPRQYSSWKDAAEERLALLREAEHELAQLRIRLSGFA